MTFRAARLILAGATAAAIALVPMAASAAPAPVAPATPGEPVLVKVPLKLIKAPKTRGLYGMALITIGDSQPIRVAVDTGSVGLRLLPGAWKTTPAGVNITKKKISWVLDGQRLSGRVGTAPFAISGVHAKFPIDFMWMDSNSWTKSAVKSGIQGVLGIGLSDQQLVNPLTLLPGAVSAHWSLRFYPNKLRTGGTGELVLGALPSSQAIATIPLMSQGISATGGEYWNDKAAPVCWQLGDLDRTCAPTYFDSMAPFMFVKGGDFAGLPTSRIGLLDTGTPVSMGAPGAAFYLWNFDAGKIFGLNAVKVSPRGPNLINAGSAMYSAFTVTYDAERGSVTFTE
jgi:hypothetical protein